LTAMISERKSMDDRQLLALVVVVQFDSLSLWERVGVRA